MQRFGRAEKSNVGTATNYCKAAPNDGFGAQRKGVNPTLCHPRAGEDKSSDATVVALAASAIDELR